MAGGGAMIRIDKSYDDYFISGATGYPGGKAKDATSESGVDGTKWAAAWFNTIAGFFQALIVEALGQFTVSGTPDRVGQSDLLNAVKKIIDDKTNPAIASVLEALALLQGPNDNHLYGRKNLQWEEIIIPPGGADGPAEVLEALKLFSKKTLMVTNTETADRRLKRFDIGLPYISPASEVYHFDTDLKNQNQTSSINLVYTAAPVLVGITDYNGQVYHNPAVSDIPPYEPLGKSLFGRYAVKTVLNNTGSTLEFWLRSKTVQNLCVFRLRAGLEDFVFTIGGPGIEYTAPAAGSIPYTAPADGSIPYTAAAASQNRVDHFSPKGSETAAITGVSITANSWLHIAAVITETKFSLFISNTKFDFSKQYQNNNSVDAIINEDKNEINIDELNVDRCAAIAAAAFIQNTALYVPYGALDFSKKWAVLMFDNPNRVATNLFESEQFKMAVKAVINNSI
jgi:hypothetical protein